MGEQSRSVTFRLSAVQWLGVRAAAEQADVPMSAWLRDVVAGRLAADELGEAVVVAEPVRTVAPAEDQRRLSRYEQWAARQPKKA